MLTLVHYDNLDEYGALFTGQFRLRHEGFLERQNYQVNQYNGMEYDQYDTPASSYLVYHLHGVALGVSRLTPTTQCCMLRDLRPDLVDDKSLLHDPLVWEGTRYCIAKSIDARLRQRIVHEMAIGYLEFGLSLGLKKIIGMMPTYIIRSVFEKPGIEMIDLGKTVSIDRHRIKAVAIPVEERQLNLVREKTGIYKNILNPSTPNRKKSTYANAA